MKINKIEIEFPFEVTIKEHDIDALYYLVGFASNGDIDCLGWHEFKRFHKCSVFEIKTEWDFHLLDANVHYISDVISRICDYNCPPGHVMWPSGQGQKPIDMDKGLWEETTFQIHVACREAHKGEKQ